MNMYSGHSVGADAACARSALRGNRASYPLDVRSCCSSSGSSRPTASRISTGWTATAASGPRIQPHAVPLRRRDASCNVVMAPRDVAPVHSDVGLLDWSPAFRKRYAVSKLLGQGSFGVVYEGVDLRSEAAVAVKFMPKARGNLSKEKVAERIAREVDMLEQLQVCRNVVRLYDCFEDENNVQIVMEVCAGGDLLQHVETHGPLDERALASTAVEILKVIGVCHQLGVFHGDVKPANFSLMYPHHNPLFSTDPELASLPWLKALDLGCSQELKGSKRLFKRSGTPIFMAPEIFRRDYGKAADMWSFGITLYWLYAQQFPFLDAPQGTPSSKSLEAIMEAVEGAPIRMDSGCWKHMSAEGVDFISRCLQREERVRLTVNEALDHPWLSDALLATHTFDFV